MDADVRADGAEAYLVVLDDDGPAEALSEDGGHRTRLLVPDELLERLGLRTVDAPFLARATADVLAEDAGAGGGLLAGQVSLVDLDRERPGFLDRVLAAAGR
ncbi:hypothetical protein [Pseudokineococcus sp. 1T1Z-3]|uniref:hypothetical protein n=1 Tax=Pseudokineococcus sp. 1T1Z-3 TaxID=3132745 RepID=UPI0030A83994